MTANECLIFDFFNKQDIIKVACEKLLSEIENKKVIFKNLNNLGGGRIKIKYKINEQDFEKQINLRTLAEYI